MALSQRQLEALTNAIPVQERDENSQGWTGFEWQEVHAAAATLNSLVSLGLLDITYRSANHTTYFIPDIQKVRDLLESASQLDGLVQEEDKGPFELPHTLFDTVVGHEQTKNIVKMSLLASDPVHVLLVGQPATAKSMILDDISHLPRSRFALGGTSSRAGIVDYLIDERPRIFIIDELDKADQRDMDILLSLMETGRVTRLKRGMREDITLRTWVYAGANSDRYISQAMKSRFIIRHLPQYTVQDFKEISYQVLVKREKIDPAWATEIADRLSGKTLDPRDAVKVARMVQERSQIDEVITSVWG